MRYERGKMELERLIKRKKFNEELLKRAEESKAPKIHVAKVQATLNKIDMEIAKIQSES